MSTSTLFGLPVWGAGTDPDTRVQHNSLVAQLEALGVRVEVGHFNDRPAAGLSPRRVYIADDTPFPGAMWRDTGPGAPDWQPLNLIASIDDHGPQLAMGGV